MAAIALVIVYFRNQIGQTGQQIGSGLSGLAQGIANLGGGFGAGVADVGSGIGAAVGSIKSVIPYQFGGTPFQNAFVPSNFQPYSYSPTGNAPTQNQPATIIYVGGGNQAQQGGAAAHVANEHQQVGGNAGDTGTSSGQDLTVTPNTREMSDAQALLATGRQAVSVFNQYFQMQRQPYSEMGHAAQSQSVQAQLGYSPQQIFFQAMAAARARGLDQPSAVKYAKGVLNG